MVVSLVLEQFSAGQFIAVQFRTVQCSAVHSVQGTEIYCPVKPLPIVLVCSLVVGPGSLPRGTHVGPSAGSFSRC